MGYWDLKGERVQADRYHPLAGIAGEGGSHRPGNRGAIVRELSRSPPPRRTARAPATLTPSAGFARSGRPRKGGRPSRREARQARQTGRTDSHDGAVHGPGGQGRERRAQLGCGLRQDDRADRALPGHARSRERRVAPLGRGDDLHGEGRRGELRRRIRDRAYVQLEQAGDDSAVHWRDVVRSLEAAPISTFHEFCVGVLRRHALDAGLDPDFEVLDATIASVLRAEALGRCLRRWLAENDPTLIDLAVEFGMMRVRDGLDALIDHRDARDLDSWVTRTEDEVVAIWKDVWIQKGREAALRPLIQSARECRQWFAAQSFEHPKLRSLGARSSASFSTSRDRIDQPDWFTWLHGQVRVPGGVKPKDWPSALANKEGLAVMASFRKGLDKWEEDDRFDESATLRAAGFSLQFAQLAVQARRAYEQAKRARCSRLQRPHPLDP